MKRALVTAPGQDGSWLCDILLDCGYHVALLHRHSSADNLFRVRHVLDRVQLLRGDVTDQRSLEQAVIDAAPDEIYHVADQDNVGWSFAAPGYQQQVTAGSVSFLLQYLVANCPHTKLFVPLSCTMFGEASAPQDEKSPLQPDSPYAQYKRDAFTMCRKFRQYYGLHVSCGIMFNHDSPRRAPGYLLQSVCRQAVEVARGHREAVVVGSLDTRVDVGYAKEYMEAAVQMLQYEGPADQKTPYRGDDYCIGTGVAWRIGEICSFALSCAYGDCETHVRPAPTTNWGGKIKVDPSLAAGPGHSKHYQANTSKAKAAFGFAPKYGPAEVIEMLVRHFQEKLK